MCLGSPLTDLCHLGFAPALAPGLRKQVTGRLLQALERFAASQAIGLLAAKDLADAHLGSGVAEALEQAGQSVWEFLGPRHFLGDWGVVDAEDQDANNEALKDGSRLLSAYILSTGVKIWIITEAEDHGNREATTALLPDEY